MRNQLSLLVLGSWFIAACSTPPVSSDARADGDAATDTALDVTRDVVACRTDIDCSDGVFCNGAERCMPGGTGANARGCLPALAPTPCAAMQVCNEAAMRCETDCTTLADSDHDGHRSIACGGDDCDDTDATRYPGNPEVCLYDASTMARVDPGHDEDCDPTTFANPTTHDGDHDGDGYVDHNCANTDRNGTTVRGPDCEDLADIMGPAPLKAVAPAAQIHPTQTELCNGIDDNCNGMVDEGVMSSFYPDCDGDGFGDAMATPMTGCAASQFTACMGHAPVTSNTDCDDTLDTVHPGAVEVCDVAMLDENCNGTHNEGCTCIDGTTVPCGSSLPGCTMGVQTCVGGVMSTCSVSATLIDCYTDADRDGFAPSGTTATMACVCPNGTTTTAPTAGANSDCDDSNASVHPGAIEACNGIDDNCNGVIDESLRIACYTDADNDGFPAAGSTAAVVCPDASRPAAGNCPLNSVGSAPTASNTDCDDTVAATPACSAPMHCTAQHVCGCEASLWYESDYLSLSTGTVSRGFSSSTSDLFDHNGTGGIEYIYVRTGRTFRHYMASFANVDASYTVGLAAGLDPAAFDAASVIVVGTPTGFYKLGFPSLITYMGSPSIHFTYAPIGTPPAGFACMM